MMKRLILLSSIVLISVLPVSGQDLVAPSRTGSPQTATQAARFNEALQIKVEEIIQQAIKEEGIPGLSVAIAINDRPFYAKGFGFADVENAVPVTIETKFRTASIAKSMTAVAVMSLVERGEIDLDAEVQTYCPDYPKKRWPLTARQLLGHLGGVRHYKSSDEDYETAHFYDLKSTLRVFKDDPLLHEPGTKHRYTTFGFNLLGSVAEGASGQKFEDLLDERVFLPAGMKSTVVDDHFKLIRHRTRYYDRPSASVVKSRGAEGVLTPDELYNAPLHDTSMKIPGGGLLSTPVDMVRLAIALNQDKLLEPSTREMMWTKQQTTKGESIGYGLGWRLKTSNNRELVYHSGSQAGASAILYLVPATGTSVAIMSNMRRVSVSSLAADIIEACD